MKQFFLLFLSMVLFVPFTFAQSNLFTGKYDYFYDDGCGGRISLNNPDDKTLTGTIKTYCKDKKGEAKEYKLDIYNFQSSTKTFWCKIPGYPKGEGPWFGKFRDAYEQGKYDIFFKFNQTEIVYAYESNPGE